MNKNTYWLASYPKSGNTWFRLFLNQILGPEQQLNINDLPIKNTIASDRISFDAGLGITSSDLLPSEIDYLRPACDELFNQSLTAPMFRKIHDAYTSPYNLQPIVSTNVAIGVIYIVRNPLDVLVSYSHHLNKSIDATLHRLNDTKTTNKPIKEVKTQLNQYMGGWSHHVLSWTKQTDIPVHLVRYEDLLEDPFKHFSLAMEFANVDCDIKAIKRAIENTRFEKLQGQESSGRFSETPRHNNRFFRKGISGSWREELTESHVSEVISHHKSVMQSLCYLDEDDAPVY